MTYQTAIICGNCGEENIFPVEDGVLVKDHLRLKTQKCLNCHFRM